MGSGYGVPLDWETYELERIFDNFFIFKVLFYQIVRGVFSFLLKNQNKELFDKTPGDPLIIRSC